MSATHDIARAACGAALRRRRDTLHRAAAAAGNAAQALPATVIEHPLRLVENARPFHNMPRPACHSPVDKLAATDRRTIA